MTIAEQSVLAIDALIRHVASRFFIERHIEPALVSFAAELSRRYDAAELAALQPDDIAALAAAYFRRQASEQFQHALSCN